MCLTSKLLVELRIDVESNCLSSDTNKNRYKWKRNEKYFFL